MKRLKFNLAGQCHTTINGLEYSIIQAGHDVFTFVNHMTRETEVHASLMHAMAAVRAINELQLPKVAQYKKTQSHKIAKLAIYETLEINESEIYKVRPLISYYKKTYNKLFTIEPKFNADLKTYLITRCR
jgi:hypothetical protein